MSFFFSSNLRKELILKKQLVLPARNFPVCSNVQRENFQPFVKHDVVHTDKKLKFVYLNCNRLNHNSVTEEANNFFGTLGFLV